MITGEGLDTLGFFTAVNPHLHADERQGSAGPAVLTGRARAGQEQAGASARLMTAPYATC